jgi:hypothetical protein
MIQAERAGVRLELTVLCAEGLDPSRPFVAGLREEDFIGTIARAAGADPLEAVAGLDADAAFAKLAEAGLL